MACQQGTLTLPDSLFRHFLGLAYAAIVETSFCHNCRVSSRLFTLNIPRYFPDFGTDLDASVALSYLISQTNVPMSPLPPLPFETKRLGLYDGTCPNLLRENNALIVVSYDCYLLLVQPFDLIPLTVWSEYSLLWRISLDIFDILFVSPLMFLY